MHYTKSQARAARLRLPFAIVLLLFCLCPAGLAATVTASPAAVNLVAPVGSDTAIYQAISLNADAAGLSYTLTLSGAWLRGSRSSGSIPGSLSLTALTRGLPVGVYQGSATFTVAGAANTPVIVPVTLTIASAAGYWTFDTADLSGNLALDRSGNGLNGAIVNATTVPGRVNQALTFSGAGSYVAVPDSAGLQLKHDLTLSAWVRTTNAAQVQNFMGKYDYTASETGYLLQLLPSGVVNLHLGGSNVSGPRDIADTTAINDGQWHHVAVVIALGQSVAFYIDGQPTSTAPRQAFSGGTSAPLYLGTSPGAYNGSPFTGSLDEVRIYAVALSADAIRTLLGNAAATITGFTPPSSPQGDAVTFTINGSGFLPGARAIFPPAAVGPFFLGILSTTFVSSTQLTAVLPRDLTMAPTGVPIQVFNLYPSGVGSNTVDYPITAVTPNLIAISPASVAAGGSDFTLTVTGDHFIGPCLCSPDPIPGTTVRFNGSPLLAANDANHITVTVPSSLIASPGTAVITVANPGNVVSNPVNLTITGTPSLTLACTQSVGPTQSGVAYSNTCTVSGGSAPYTWSINPGYLPLGLSSAATGATLTIAGTPTFPSQNYSYTVHVVDSSSPAPRSASQTYSGSIASAMSLTCTNPRATVQAGVVYTSTCTARGGVGPFRFDARGTNAPPLTVSDRTATISVTPSDGYQANFTVTVMDSSAPSQTARQDFFLTVPPKLVCTVPAGPNQVGVTYLTSCVVSYGAIPYTWTITGSLPSGLQMDVLFSTTAASISGTPTTTGPYNYTLTVTDTMNPANQASQTFTGTIYTTPPLPTGLAGYWTFDTTDISGNILVDESGHGLTGSIFHGATIAGRVNQAMSFSGAGSYVAVRDDPGLRFSHDLTLTAWINTTNSTQVQNFLGKYDFSGTETGYLLQVLPSGVVNLHLGGSNVASGSRDIADTTVINNGQWHYVAVLIPAAGRVQFYIDGFFTSMPAQITAAFGEGSSFYMGTYPGAFNGQPFTGALDEVRVFSRLLTPTEILTLAGGTGPEITSVSPTSVPYGSGPFTLTVNGAGFASNAMVLVVPIAFNGIPDEFRRLAFLQTTFVSSNKLTALVPRDFTYGNFDVQVFNGYPGGASSNTASIASIPVTPVITSLTPSGAAAGGPDFTLTVDGSNFISPCICTPDPELGATVRWNGTRLMTTWVSANRITATVPASLIATAGTAVITVANTGYAMLSAPATFTITGAPGSLAMACGPSSTVQPDVVSSVSCSASGGTPPYSWVEGDSAPAFTISPDTSTISFHFTLNAANPLLRFQVGVSDATHAAMPMQTLAFTAGNLFGPAGSWAFDSISGGFTPEWSGNNLSSRVVNATLVPGRVNQALSFSGANSYVTVQDSASLDLTHDLSLTAWVNTSNTTQVQDFISKYDFTGSETGYLLQLLPGGTLNLHTGGNNLASGSRDVHDSTAINDGHWHHVAVVITLGQTVAFYVDGSLTGTYPLATIAARNGSPLYLGTFPNLYNGLPFTGSLDEVRIFSRALTGSEVSFLAHP